MLETKAIFLKQEDKDLTGQLKHKIQFALNETPKEVLGYSTPSEVYTSRQNDDIFEKVRKASAKCYKRKQRREVKKGGGVSIIT